MLMMQTYQQSIQESSEDSPSFNPFQVIHHVLKNVLGLFVDERVSFSNWMDYNDYLYIHEPCEELPHRLKDLHECSD